jgi:hypothetical protein
VAGTPAGAVWRAAVSEETPTIEIKELPPINEPLAELESLVNRLNDLRAELMDHQCFVRLYEVVDAFGLYYVPEVELQLSKIPYDRFIVKKAKKLSVEKEK